MEVTFMTIDHDAEVNHKGVWLDQIDSLLVDNDKILRFTTLINKRVTTPVTISTATLNRNGFANKPHALNTIPEHVIIILHIDGQKGPEWQQHLTLEDHKRNIIGVIVVSSGGSPFEKNISICGEYFFAYELNDSRSIHKDMHFSKLPILIAEAINRYVAR